MLTLIFALAYTVLARLTPLPTNEYYVPEWKYSNGKLTFMGHGEPAVSRVTTSVVCRQDTSRILLTITQMEFNFTFNMFLSRWLEDYALK